MTNSDEQRVAWRRSRARMSRVLVAMAAIGAMIMAVGAAPAPAAADGKVADIVAKMPAYDPATGQPMLEEILKLGPDALKELCSLITPPQDTGDAKARYAVHGLVLYTKRPGAEADRAKVEKALIDALAAAKDPDLKVFFIEQLQLCGSDAAADAIAALLGEDRLCDPAATAQSKVVFDALNDSDPAVRKAAVKALAGVAASTDVDRVLALMLAETDEGQQTAIQGVLVSLCRKANSPKCVLDALVKADAKQKPLLLATLARIGGDGAFSAVMKEMESADTVVKDAATRALTDWQGADAIQPLWKLAADTKSDVYRVLAIRGIVRIVGRDTKLPPGDAASALCHAFAYSKTPAEKNLVVGALGNIRTVESLEVLARYFDDKDAGELAAATAVRIACPATRREKGLTGPAVREALEKVVSVSKNAAVVEQAKKYLVTMNKGK